MNSITRFVIIGAPRSSSSFLVRYLSRHPEIHCHGEILKENAPPLRWPANAEASVDLDHLQDELKSLKNEHPMAFLERVYSLSFEKRIVGFKIFRHHNPSALGKILEDESILKVVIYRSNVLARWASHQAAIKAGDFSRRAEKPKAKFNVRKFLKYHNADAAFYKHTFQALEKSGQRFHLVRYEEINNTGIMAGLFRFLGVEKAPPVPPAPPDFIIRRASDDTLERFRNRKAAKRFLDKSGNPQWAHEREIHFEPLTMGPTAEEISDVAGESVLKPTPIPPSRKPRAQRSGKREQRDRIRP